MEEKRILCIEKLKKKINLKFCINILTVFGTILLCYFIYFGIKNQLFTSKEAMTKYLEGAGIFAPIIFIFVQIVQVIIPIIPGGVSCAVGVLVFGPVFGFIYNYFSIVSGSIIVFFIARKYGMPLIQKMFEQKLINKYIGWLNKEKRFEKLFAIAIFLPVAPDDFLCYLAGITKIAVKKYIAIIVLLKPFTILAYSLSLAWISKILLKFL